jgi:hypothetical protein
LAPSLGIQQSTAEYRPLGGRSRSTGTRSRRTVEHRRHHLTPHDRALDLQGRSELLPIAVRGLAAPIEPAIASFVDYNSRVRKRAAAALAKPLVTLEEALSRDRSYLASTHDDAIAAPAGAAADPDVTQQSE